jgi:hypothetical protein
MPQKRKKPKGKTKTTAAARNRPGRTARPAEAVSEHDDRQREVVQEYAGLRERSSVLEARYSDLEEAHHELAEEHVGLKERARVIDERYTELVERTDEGSAPGTIQISPVELEALRDELTRLRQERDVGATGARMACPKCGGGLEEITHEDVTVDRCPACGGIYLDKGELERLTAKREPEGFFRRLSALFA